MGRVGEVRVLKNLWMRVKPLNRSQWRRISEIVRKEEEEGGGRRTATASPLYGSTFYKCA
jgi:hypothetical protein